VNLVHIRVDRAHPSLRVVAAVTPYSESLYDTVVVVVVVVTAAGPHKGRAGSWIGSKPNALFSNVGVLDISQIMSNNDPNHTPQRPQVGEDSRVLLATYPMASTTPVTHRTSFATLPSSFLINSHNPRVSLHALNITLSTPVSHHLSTLTRVEQIPAYRNPTAIPSLHQTQARNRMQHIPYSHAFAQLSAPVIPLNPPDRALWDASQQQAARVLSPYMNYE